MVRPALATSTGKLTENGRRRFWLPPWAETNPWAVGRCRLPWMPGVKSILSGRFIALGRVGQQIQIYITPCCHKDTNGGNAVLYLWSPCMTINTTPHDCF